MHCRICKGPAFSDPCLACKVRLKEREEAQRAAAAAPEPVAGVESHLYRCLRSIYAGLRLGVQGQPAEDGWNALDVAIHTIIGRGILAAPPPQVRAVAEKYDQLMLEAREAEAKKNQAPVPSLSSSITAPASPPSPPSPPASASSES